ncbi:MAG: TetR family transcriptional regulator [Actinobacteria bacterium]|uniref:Unannotated protein n=1 Tax=freshwater metagenome TaxID=449393 RepID=A0A6J6NZH3_9ZZZZ|nr:TetR family transcriptional regulator [Actinomycetota bacterium]
MTEKTPASGRKSAYYLRNRAQILSSAQKLIATAGDGFTIEDVAKDADMAASTIYKHFESREALINEAIVSAMKDWEDWAIQQSSTLSSDLEQLIAPMLLFIAMSKTHPTYAQIAVNAQSALEVIEPQLTANLGKHIKRLASAGVLESNKIEDRLANLISCLRSAFFQSVKGNQTGAQSQIALALTMLGIREVEASKQVSALAKVLKNVKR